MHDPSFFTGTLWAITGSLPGGLTRRTATAKLKALGAAVTSSISPRVTYLVSGSYNPDNDTWLTTKEIQARQHGTTILSGAQLKRLLDGEPPERVLAATPQRTAPAPVAVHDALVGFRDLLYDTSDEALWDTLCGLVDQCPAEDLPIVLDYIEGNLAGQEERYDVRHNIWNGQRTPMRALTPRWREEVCQGKNSEKLRLIRVCNLHNAKLTSKVGAQLLACTHLSNVRYLDLGRNKLTSPFFKALRQAEQFKHLTHLYLGDLDLNPACAAAFAGPSALANVTDLCASARFEGDALRIFFQAECWANLRTLIATSIRDASSDPLDALALAPHIDKLEVLDVGWSTITPASVEAFAARKGLDHLRELRLACAPLSPQAAEAFTRAPWLDRLEILELAHASGEGVPTLLASPRLGRLKELHAPTEQGALIALCGNHTFAPERLELTGDIGARAFSALLRAPWLPGLRHLILHGALPEDATLRMLRHPDLGRLETLGLYKGRFGPDEATALTLASWLSGLTRLDARWHGNLTEHHIRDIEQAEHLTPTLRQRVTSWLRHIVQL